MSRTRQGTIMPASTRCALALALATLALPATASARPLPPNYSRGDDHSPARSVSQPYADPHGVEAAPPFVPSTNSRATSSSTDTTPAAARPASPPEGGYRVAAARHDTTPWPEIAFAGVVLLASVGGLVRLRLRRRLAA
jgi:hypothetical protein